MNSVENAILNSEYITHNNDCIFCDSIVVFRKRLCITPMAAILITNNKYEIDYYKNRHLKKCSFEENIVVLKYILECLHGI